MGLLLKRIHQQGATEPPFYRLGGYDPESGKKLFSLHLPDRPYADGYSIASYFRLSPDGRLLVIDSLKRFLSDNDYSLQVLQATNGVTLYRSEYHDLVRFSLDGRYIYILKDEWFFGDATQVVDAANGAPVMTVADKGALFHTGLEPAPLQPQELETAFISQEALESSLRRARLHIEAHLSQLGYANFWTVQVGAIELDPDNLVLWICVPTDADKARLQADPGLVPRIRQILQDSAYPPAAVEAAQIGVESEETVQRESQGNWYWHWL